MADELTCDEIRGELPELALGVLVGSDRSRVLAHLDRCAECSAELEELSRATDALLGLVPEMDPPAGFEVRLLARRAEQQRTLHDPNAGRTARHRPWRIRALGAVAAIVLLGAGAGIGAATSNNGPGPSSSVRTAALSFDGRGHGTVSIYSGSPAWVFMSVSGVHTSGWVRCVVSEKDGREVVVGRFLLDGSYGAWTAQLSVPPTDIVGARVESSSGATLASASLDD